MAGSCWEHRSVSVRYDRQRSQNWILEREGQSSLVGFSAILEAFDAGGWELISLTLLSSRAVKAFDGWHIEPCSYRATFRRKVEEGLRTTPDRNLR